MREAKPPSRKPAWRWLYVLVISAVGWVIAAESATLSTSLRGSVELVAAVVTIAGVILWVRANRETLSARDLERRHDVDGRWDHPRSTLTR